jgi:hypothetical protein
MLPISGDIIGASSIRGICVDQLKVTVTTNKDKTHVIETGSWETGETVRDNIAKSLKIAMQKTCDRGHLSNGSGWGGGYIGS